MEKNDKLKIVFVTTNHYENATMIAKNIISEQIAACCTIIPNATSYFLWNDKMNIQNEYILIIKTLENQIDELESRVKELHEYDVPEFIVVSSDSVNSEYFDWINKVLNTNN